MNNLFVNKRQVRQFLFNINVHCNEQRGKILSSLFLSFADDEETNIAIFITIIGKWVVYFFNIPSVMGNAHRCHRWRWVSQLIENLYRIEQLQKRKKADM